MKVLIDADDAALGLKTLLVEYLRGRGFDTVDLAYQDSVEGECYYPDVAYNLALKLVAGEGDLGILLCGTGLGMAITANKVEGVYAGTAHDTYSAQRLRKSNNANVLTLGARVVGPELAKSIVDAWLSSEFSGGGSAPKVAKMRDLEALSFRRFLSPLV